MFVLICTCLYWNLQKCVLYFSSIRYSISNEEISNYSPKSMQSTSQNLPNNSLAILIDRLHTFCTITKKMWTILSVFRWYMQINSPPYKALCIIYHKIWPNRLKPIPFSNTTNGDIMTFLNESNSSRKTKCSTKPNGGMGKKEQKHLLHCRQSSGKMQ